MNWPVFFKRLGSAIIFSAVMMFGLLYPDPTAILVLAILIQFLCLKEFYHLGKLIFPEAQFHGWMHWFLQVAGIIVICSFIIEPFFLLLLVLPILLLLAAVLSKRTALQAGLVCIVALLYISLPLGMLVQLRQLHIVIPVALVLMIWMNDTMAYIVGSFIGRTPFSSISPKKTWEGTIGGVFFTIVGAIIWAIYTPYEDVGSVPYWIALGLAVCIAGTAGDLLESKLKRMAGVKDSGNLMPGHGGALDRFDSLLATLPFAFIISYLILSIE